MYHLPFEAAHTERLANGEPVVLYGDDHFLRANVLVQAEGFGVNACLTGIGGPAVEADGPTAAPYYILLDTTPHDDMLITDITNGPYKAGAQRVRLLADASRLPSPDKSMGSLFASNLDYGEGLDLRRAFIRESARILKSDDLLILQGMSESELTHHLGRYTAEDRRENAHLHCRNDPSVGSANNINTRVCNLGRNEHLSA
jgi:hypothetical protein